MLHVSSMRSSRFRTYLAMFLTCALIQTGCFDSPTERSLKKASRLCEDGKYAEAVRAFNAAIEADPDNIVAHYKLANLYKESLNDKDMAIKHFQRVVELDPQYSKAWEKMAVLYDRKKDRNAVIQTLKKAMEEQAFDDKPEMRKEMQDWLVEMELKIAEPPSGDISTTRPALEDLPGD